MHLENNFVTEDLPSVFDESSTHTEETFYLQFKLFREQVATND